jgi:hypothetical protein
MCEALWSQWLQQWPLMCQLRQKVAPSSILGGKAYVLLGGAIFLRKVETLPILMPYVLKTSLKAPLRRRSGSAAGLSFSFCGVARPMPAPLPPGPPLPRVFDTLGSAKYLGGMLGRFHCLYWMSL